MPPPGKKERLGSSLALRHLKCVLTQLQGQIYLISETFIQNLHKQIEMKPTFIEIPKAQIQAEKALTGFA